jgi:hypothetical protein
VTEPSRRRIPLICDRRSESCIVGPYVEATFGIRTGVLGSEVMVLANCEAISSCQSTRCEVRLATKPKLLCFLDFCSRGFSQLVIEGNSFE